jgi:hypothetical protein
MGKGILGNPPVFLGDEEAWMRVPGHENVGKPKPKKKDTRNWQQKSRDYLNETGRKYLGPHGDRAFGLLGMASEFSDAADIRDAMDYSKKTVDAVRQGDWWGAAGAAPWMLAATGAAMMPGVSMGMADEAVEGVKKGIRAYHASPNDFDEFQPSEFRGASFFSPSEKGARYGAEAARNEMVMETATDLPSVNWRTYEVDIDLSRIKGLALTPKEIDWFSNLPQKVVGDENLEKVMKDNPSQLYWDDVYEPKQISETLFEYTKKDSPPSKSYEDAVKTGRDVYHRQWPHYNNGGTNEKAAARNTVEDGMGGYLVQDEGGLSIAVTDPKIIQIVSKYGIAGASAILGYNVLQGMDPAQAAELQSYAPQQKGSGW